MRIYMLRSENLTGLGGPMGSEHTFSNWCRYFSSIDKAKRAAFANYRFQVPADAKASMDKFWWIKTRDEIRTPDLGFVMYHISEVKVE